MCRWGERNRRALTLDRGAAYSRQARQRMASRPACFVSNDNYGAAGDAAPPSGGRRWGQPCAGSDRIRHRRAWQHSVSCACNSAAPVGRGRRPGRCHEPGTPSQPHPARADGARQAGRRARRISPATPHSCPGRRKRPCSRRSRMQGGRTVRPSSTPWGPARHGCFRTRPLMQIWAPRLTHSDMPSGTLSQVSQQTRRQTRIGTRRRSGGWLRKCLCCHR